jgi:hypothetical protein
VDSLNQVKKMGTMGGNDGKDGDIHQLRKRWGHPSTAEKMGTSINPAGKDGDIHQLLKRWGHPLTLQR